MYLSIYRLDVISFTFDDSRHCSIKPSQCLYKNATDYSALYFPLFSCTATYVQKRSHRLSTINYYNIIPPLLQFKSTVSRRQSDRLMKNRPSWLHFLLRFYFPVLSTMPAEMQCTQKNIMPTLLFYIAYYFNHVQFSDSTRHLLVHVLPNNVTWPSPSLTKNYTSILKTSLSKPNTNSAYSLTVPLNICDDDVGGPQTTKIFNSVWFSISRQSIDLHIFQTQAETTRLFLRKKYRRAYKLHAIRPGLNSLIIEGNVCNF